MPIWYDQRMQEPSSQPEPGRQPQFQDITLYDVDTGEAFVFTAKEQEFFAKQGFTNAPKRAPHNRKKKRELRAKGKDTFDVVCMRCKKVGNILQEPPDPRHILCEYCFEELWNENLENHPELKQLFAESV